MPLNTVDWASPEAHVSAHFTVKDALWLPQWGRLATAEDGLTDAVKASLLRFFEGPVESARAFLRVPMNVHCGYRPPAYNALVKGAAKSAHLCLGDWAAIDWDPIDQTCDWARGALAWKLEEFGIRMERRPGSNWVHIDNKPVPKGGQRFFFP